MPKDIEELKIILDLAKAGGKMEEQLRQTMAENKTLKAQIKEKDKTIEEHVRQLDAKGKEIAEKDMRIRELEAIVAGGAVAVAAPNADNNKNAGSVPPLVVIQQYILLDGAKTVAYVCSLDNDHKMFAGHLLHHTMAANTPKHIYDRVDAMTQLESNQTGRLADAVEKMADKPTEPTVRAEHYYGAGANHEDHSRNISLDDTKLLE